MPNSEGPIPTYSAAMPSVFAILQPRVPLIGTLLQGGVAMHRTACDCCESLPEPSALAAVIQVSARMAHARALSNGTHDFVEGPTAQLT